ncbi:phytoene desaturase family protein [Amycolatopsis anabasis]|uniref:phytoene desaturase family protein n=1 Tax=Amycolatopsis anabasis TaxID=1840409 RepID=UPI00131E2A51|nr:NAD(P)/FAD-dependent oxidoreductase [Amycolatopsis anabasis]
MIPANATAKWDAIVVGSGIGGLVCAGYLAASGRRVLVLEQHDVAGGNSHVFRRRRAYEFDVGVHYLGDCGPGGLLPSILGGLGLADRVRFHPMDPDGFDRIVLPSVTVDVPTGWARYGDRLRRALPDEADGITRYVDICSAVAETCRESTRSAPGGKLPAVMVRWSRRTLAHLFDHCGLSPRARTVLAAQSGNYGSAPGQTLVVAHTMMIDDYLRGAYYPEGGGQMVAAALVELLESHGGALRTKTRVRRIRIDGDRVAGVELSDGAMIDAPIVVSNADYRRTVLELCGGAENLPAPVVDRAEGARMRLPTAVCYVALDTELPERPNANIWYWATEDVDRAYERLEAGSLEPEFAFLSFASVKDPVAGSACPPGHTNFQIMTACPPGYAPWGLREGPASGGKYRREPAYRAAKDRLTERMLDLAEAAIGPFRDHIVHRETSTPLTQERYTLSTGGTAYGLRSWGRVGQRPDVHTGVSGLFLAGQNIHHAGGIVGVATSGAACASAILGRSLLPEVCGGAVFGNPDLLPARTEDWDPLRVSRGLDRRDARGLARLDLAGRTT